MAITSDQSPLQQDIADITSQSKADHSQGFECEVKLHTVSKDLDRTDGLVVSVINVYRDYVENVSDYIEIELSCWLGTYVYDVYPHMDNLEVTILSTRQDKPGGKLVKISERYKAVYLLHKNTTVPTETNLPKTALNQNPPIVFTLQLIDRSAETIRIKTVQGSFDPRLNPKNKDMTPGAFIKSIITEHTNKILIENKPSIDVFNIEPPDNKQPLKAITIPSGTRLVEVVELLQTKSDGVYASGIGNYIQRFGSTKVKSDKVYFVYSLYNGKKYHQAENKIIFYCPPTSVPTLSEVTYSYNDKILKVIGQTLSKIDDVKESLVMSTGSGYRASNANSYTKKPVEMTLKGPKFKKTGLNTEVIYKERADGLNFAPSKGVSSNNFVNASEVLSKVGKYVTVKAMNIDIDFLFPGAPCKIVYDGKSSSVSELYGVLHRVRATLGQPAMNMMHLYNSNVVTLQSQVELEIFVTD